MKKIKFSELLLGQVLLFILTIFACSDNKNIKTVDKVKQRTVIKKNIDKKEKLSKAIIKPDKVKIRNKFKIFNMGSSETGIILKAKNLVYNINNKQIVIPVFRGKKGTLYINNLKDHCKKNNIDPDDFFVIRSRRGHLKKDLMKFLRFYKKSILKDVDIAVPVNMLIESDAWFIDYNFEIEGLPFSLGIIVYAGQKDFDQWGDYRNIFQIITDETMKRPYFEFHFTPNVHVDKVEVWGQKLGK